MIRPTILILLALLVACSGAPRALVSPGGRLTAENRTAEPLEVFVDGTRVAVVAAGAEAKMDRLALGDRQVLAVGLDTGFRIPKELTLVAEAPTVWRVTQSDEHTRTLDRRPRGAIQARNRAPEPVRVFVDGNAREMIWPAGEAEYRDIAPGVHLLRAEGVKTGFSTDSEVVVGADVTPVFDVIPPSGAVRVRNETPQSCRVTVQGVAFRTLASGQEFTASRIDPGTVRILFMDTLGRSMGAVETTVERGKVAEVRVPVPAGVLAVISDLPEAVALVADGRTLGECPARGGSEFRGLVPGTTRLQAMKADGTIVARGRIVVPVDGQGVWMVKPGMGSELSGDEGSLLVRNASREPLRIQVNGADRGEIQPGGRRLVPRLPAAKHAVRAVGLRTGDLHEAVVAVGPGAQVEWIARPAVATLVLKNSRTEDVRVLLDGVELAIVPAGASEIRKVNAGRHAIESRGISTLDGTVQEVELPVSTETVLTLASPFATLVVTNRQTEALSISVDEREMGVVLPGDRVTLRHIPPGTLRLVARTPARPLTWTATVRVGPGETYDWDLKR